MLEAVRLYDADSLEQIIENFESRVSISSRLVSQPIGALPTQGRKQEEENWDCNANQNWSSQQVVQHENVNWNGNWVVEQMGDEVLSVV